jgi:hypothetical protein
MLFCLVLLVCSVAVDAKQSSISQEDRVFLRHLQRHAFDYFWYESGTNGLIQDRMTDKKLSSTMAAGFQLPALCVGAENEWITRSQAVERVTTILETYARLPRFHGMFAHYYDIETGEVIPLMHEKDNGADVSETGFLMAGILTVRNYFNGTDRAEKRIQQLATKLYEEVEWDWMLQDGKGRRHTTLAWHWSPDHGFFSGQRVRSNMELSSMITYLLAIGSPTHPIPPKTWHEGWAADYQWLTMDKHTFIACPPLFAHQYPQVWIDFRNRRDRFADYFRNSRYATLANRAYCLRNLYPDHDVWGLTYCDGPEGYGIYGYPPKRGEIDRDAVTPPTAPAGSLPFTPRESLSTLRYVFNNFHDRMWGKYGLYDAFSLKHDWFFDNYVAIDQGPIVLMIENLLSGFVWDTFMQDPVIDTALNRIGSVQMIDDFEPAVDVEPYCLWQPSEGYACTLTRKYAIDGRRALTARLVNPDAQAAGFTAVPALRDFTDSRYLSLWLAGTPRLRIELEDSARQKTVLNEAGRLTSDEGWTHLYFELPADGNLDLSDVASITFAAPEAEPTDDIIIDRITLTDILVSERPAGVRRLRAEPSRMPGEVVLTWDHSDEADCAFRHLVRYANRDIETPEDFENALRVKGKSYPVVYGSTTNLYINGLAAGEYYSFAVRTEDLAFNRSDTQTTGLQLPRQKTPSEFMIDDFDRAEDESGVIGWSSSSPSVKVAVSEETALMGRGALKVDYNKQGEGDQWAYVAADLDFRDLSQHRYLALWVSGQAEILAKAYSSEGQQQDIETQRASMADGWSPVYFDLSKLVDIDRSAVSRLMFFIAPGKTDVSGSLLIDQLRLTMNRN